jgi:hypothetical protein
MLLLLLMHPHLLPSRAAAAAVQAMCTGLTLTERGLAVAWMQKGSTSLTHTVRCQSCQRIDFSNCIRNIGV